MPDLQMQSPLRDICDTAQNLRDLLASRSILNHERHTSIDVPALDLPSASSILEDFKQSGVPPEIIRRSAKALVEMEYAFRQNYQKTCYQLAAVHQPSELPPVSLLIDKLRHTFQATYAKHDISRIKEQVLAATRNFMPSDAVTQIKRPSRDANDKKQRFNNTFLPFLEKYFEYNAYPSHADRALMAKKSMMTERQIEVWFQNHRNRARKDGRTLKRMRATDPLPSQLFLESLEEKMCGFIRPESERTGVDSCDSEESYSDEEDVSVPSSKPPSRDAPNVLNATAPADAPLPPYKPSCQDSPFLVDDKFCFLEPVWPRIPAISPTHSKTINSDEFDEFIALFAKLTVREGLQKPRGKHMPPGNSTKPRRASTLSSKPDRSAATCSITTILPTAPHPALIRPKISLRVTPPSPLPTVRRTPRSRPHAFRTPSPQSRLATLVPPSQPASSGRNLPGQRKVARLPRRTPGSTSVAHRGISPASSDASPSPSHSFSPHSRTSSFGSDCSSQTRMSSNSSCSSTSTLATPLFTPSTLPETFPSPSSMSTGFNFNSQNMQNIEDLFGDSSLGALSPVEGLQLNFTSGGAFSDGSTGKQTFDFSFAAPHAAYTVHAQS